MDANQPAPSVASSDQPDSEHRPGTARDPQPPAVRSDHDVSTDPPASTDPLASTDPAASSDPNAPETVTAGVVDQGRRAGTDEGSGTLVELVDRVTSRGGRPGAIAVLDDASAKIVAFEFGAGDVLAEHAARHPALIQVIRGRVEFALPDRTIELVPGQVLHLTPMLRHGVRALEPTTLVVTMLLPHD